ncbi:hypothetical protein M0813_24857 [Anaeramoeba flamelloides]|uniref:Uncharacterized protein n=1 Tax=Anaeramoeba flamelloides TaxID=1746091 RepID=A0ABQ8Y533_9EUKA|nr:hypothetical protein M0813_24857 [Anaeramoeba flamelloides]
MSRLENFNNFAQAVRVIDSKRSLKELKKNIKALSTQEEQQGIKFLWDNLPEGFPKIRPRESIINTARAIAFGQRVVNFHQVPMELNNLSVDQQISQETSDEVPEEALRNLTNNERKSKRRKRARKKRTKKKTKTNTNTHTNTKAKTKTYTNTNTIPEVHNKDEYKRKVDLPPKEYWHFGWCILSFVIGWGFIIGLCFVAVPCSKVRFWDLHINNCEIDWTKTTRNASFADRHGKTHQGTLQSGCAPKEDNQNIKGKYSCWSNPKDSSQIHMVPEYRTAACVAAISCGAILGFIFQLPIPLARNYFI